MRIQKVSAGRGAAWLNESIGLLKTGGKSVWLPALLIGILNSLPWVGAALSLLMIFFYAGLVLCFDKPNGGYTVFSGFSDGGFIRLLPLIALNIILAVVAVIALFPSMKPAFDATMNGVQPTNDEAMKMVVGLAKHLIWLIPVGIFLSWITQFAVPLASLKKISGGESIKLALRATSTNISALIVNFFCLIAIVFLVLIIFMIPITLVGTAFADNLMLKSLMEIPLIALLSAILIALMCGNMLYAYRDVFEHEPELETETKSSEALF